MNNLHTMFVVCTTSECHFLADRSTYKLTSWIKGVIFLLLLSAWSFLYWNEFSLLVGTEHFCFKTAAWCLPLKKHLWNEQLHKFPEYESGPVTPGWAVCVHITLKYAVREGERMIGDCPESQKDAVRKGGGGDWGLLWNCESQKDAVRKGERVIGDYPESQDAVREGRGWLGVTLKVCSEGGRGWLGITLKVCSEGGGEDDWGLEKTAVPYCLSMLNCENKLTWVCWHCCSHDHTDTPVNSTQVIVAMTSFKSKIIRIKVGWQL